MVRSASFGGGPFCRQPGQISFFRGAGSRRRCEFGGGARAALGLCQSALLCFDLDAKGGCGQTFGVCLLCGSRFGLGCHALGLCRAGPPLGGKTFGGGTRSFGFPLGAAMGLLCRLFFCRHTQQGCGFGVLLDPQLFGSLVGRASFRFSPLGGEPGQFLFLLDPDRGGAGKFGGGALTAPDIFQRALFSIDLPPQFGYHPSLGELAALDFHHRSLLGLDPRPQHRVGEALCLLLLCRSGRRLGCRTLALRGAGLLLGGKARNGGTRCFGLLFDATHGFDGCLVFSRRTRQGRGFGVSLGPQLLGGLVGRASFGVDSLRGQPDQFLFLLRTGCGCTGQFGSGKLAPFGLRHSTLLRLDSRAKSGSGLTFGLRLGCRALSLRGLGLLLGGEALDYGAPCFDVLFGATPGFRRRLIFRRRTRPRRSFSFPLDTQLLGSLIGRVSLGGGALCGHERQFLFLPDPGRGGAGQVDGGALIALGFRKASLFFRDSRP